MAAYQATVLPRLALAIAALLSSGCSALMTFTGGYAHSISGEHAGNGGYALHGALGVGGGARGEGAGVGAHARFKTLDHADELALGGHLYIVNMEVEESGRIFTKTSPWGFYSRLNLNLVEFERYEQNDLVSSLGPSIDVGLLFPYALSANLSLERDVRFEDEPDETFVLFMLGIGFGSVGPF